MLVRHTFPLDGEYTFQVKLYRTNLNIVRGLEYPHQVEFTVDGQRVHLATIGGKADLAAHVREADGYRATPSMRGCACACRSRPGRGRVAVAFVQDPAVEDSVRLQRYVRSSADKFDWAGRPHMQTLTITGPFNATGPGDTPSRRRIFVCRPAPRGRRTRRAPGRFSRRSPVARIASRSPTPTCSRC